MGRWTDMDDDSQRLPEGMKRIGYDADTQSYTFRDASGALYESAPGARYGELTRVGTKNSAQYSDSSSDEHEAFDRPPARSFEEMEQRNRAVGKGNREAVRMMLPFVLLVLVVLLLVFKLVGGTWADDVGEQVLDCGQGSHQIEVREGDTCWEIAKGCGLGVEELLKIEGNEGVVCEALGVGTGVCVPEGNGRAGV
ncbi:hypothetical protein CC86DRAFT_295626 [Ophiobolus disseminans]|uniref:LysM domain-containing protein n=1 Tax=Ophiobolus disseminans TaxID=1469910 RepID=A0A6A6ZV19_9PLEO|nr:hypothetical protein CC86DRAFT_295626 [Ophiobolus disseminans]